MDAVGDFTSILDDIEKKPANGSLAALFVSLGASQARLWSNRASFFDLVKGVHKDPIAQQIHQMLANNIKPDTFDKVAKILLESSGSEVHNSTKNVRSTPLSPDEVSMDLREDEFMGNKDSDTAKIMSLETAILLFVIADQLHYALCEDGPTANSVQTYGVLPPRTGIYDPADVKLRAASYNWYHFALAQRQAAAQQKTASPPPPPEPHAARSLIQQLHVRSMRRTNNQFEINLIELSLALVCLRAPARPDENYVSRYIARMYVHTTSCPTPF